jgi:hypothetical protein
LCSRRQQRCRNVSASFEGHEQKAHEGSDTGTRRQSPASLHVPEIVRLPLEQVLGRLSAFGNQTVLSFLCRHGASAVSRSCSEQPERLRHALARAQRRRRLKSVLFSLTVIGGVFVLVSGLGSLI